jgi:hypothetical protein
MAWEIDSVSTQIIYDQAQRAALGRGDPYFFWPDGSIAFLPAGDQYRFFAPNGGRTARMLGTFDDPGATLETGGISIQGIDPQFPFASGGSIYRDPETGMLLLFYHAERYLEGNPSLFHASLGIAVSEDEGQSFRNLGIILETNASPNANAPCCADMGGAPYMIQDGQFYLYFRDRMADLYDIQLAVATAPVAEVVEAARNGTTSPWFKYFNGAKEPGLMGRSSPLEEYNPGAAWFSVSHNTYLNKFIMAVASHPGADNGLYLIASEDGITWSPRVLVYQCDCDLTYPTIISPDGDPFNTGQQFYVYNLQSVRGIPRWQDSALHRATVTLKGEMVELPHAWEFEQEGDREGWSEGDQIGSLMVKDGAMVISPTGNDPFLYSPTLGFRSTTYSRVEIRMRVDISGTGQFFITSTDAPNISESSSVRFAVTASEDFQTYFVDLSTTSGWSSRIKMLRFDPIDQKTQIEIDYIRMLP